ncbi:MAG: RNA-binding protein [Patescibacteria group bacterium]
MSARLFVGGVPYRMSEGELRSSFSQAGEVVSVMIPLDHQTKRPRGFAFVEMADQASADEAISLFNGKNLGGRPLFVNPSRPSAKSQT